MRKRKLLSLLLIIPLLTSCVGVTPIELGDRLMIEAIGLDKTPDGCRLTLLCDDWSPKDNEQNTDGEKAILITVNGKTPGEAFAKVAVQTGLQPLYSETKLLIAGKNTAVDDLYPMLDFFLREYKTRSNLPLCVANTSAEKLLSAFEAAENNTVTSLKNIMKLGVSNGTVVDMPLFRFVNLLISDTDAAYCPYLSLTEEGSITPVGTAVFRQSTLSAVISNRQTTVLLLLNNRLKKAGFTVIADDTAFTVSVIRANTKIRIKTETQIEIHTKIQCDVTDYQASSDRINNDALQNTLEKYLVKQIKDLSDTLFSLEGCDFCRFAKRMALTFYPLPSGFQQSTDENVNISPTVTVKIRRTGKESAN